MNDAEKHAKALRETGLHAVFLPASLYRMAEQAGYDMTGYVVTPMIPTGHGVFVIEHKMPTSKQRRERIDDDIANNRPLGASHVPNIQPGVFVAGTAARWPCPGYRKGDKP